MMPPPESDEQTLRRLLWLYHGHSGAALYGDDGEMQCHACPLDFRRDPVGVIAARFYEAALRAVPKAVSAP